MKTYDELKALIERRGVHAEFGEPGEGWGIEQNPHELASFLVRMQELNVQSVLEIGTGYKGGLSRFLAHDMGWDVTTVDIQPYGNVFEGVHYIVGDKPTFDRQFDLVFIDGDHSYEGVWADFDKWLINADKAIAFHDILGLRDCEGSARFWHQVLLQNISYKHDMIVNDVMEGASGIGWIEL